MLGLLFRQPNLSVSAVARQLKVALPVASQYLRALEARGLLSVRRAKGRVKYCISATPSGADAQELIKSLKWEFRRDTNPIETLFKVATTFTQPRRIGIFQALKQQPLNPRQLKALSKMSGRAVARHLRKLAARGFVVCRRGVYSLTDLPEGFGRTLARVAGNEKVT